ncbi:MAG: hypothetical protein EBZ67_13235, partial [Chitinophagia bacterium]|nr:hypothetical protein [Chitinophagia bacterium]
MAPPRKSTPLKGNPVRKKLKAHTIRSVPRDISWLSFNARVLQEAADPTVSLRDRIRFLGIFSNNLDEFFRVRVAALGRMVRYGSRANMHLERSPRQILDAIQHIVMEQQEAFNRIWEGIQSEDALLVAALDVIRSRATELNADGRADWLELSGKLDAHLETLCACAQALRVKLELLKDRSRDEVDLLVQRV